jgi:NAD+ kinase
MKIQLVGQHLDDIHPLLEARGFEISDQQPDLIITHGGDGTLLGAEREFPGIPKFPIRDKRTAPRCKAHSCEFLLDLLLEGKLSKTSLMKLSGCSNGREMTGINDVLIHNLNRVSAVRYQVWINDELYAGEIVGDGACVSTVHGSTAYYRSITHSIFRVGIGLAFSNSTELTNHLVLPENSCIRFKILRGPAIMVADNTPNYVELKEGDEAVIKKIDDQAEVYGLDLFMCPECRKLRHLRKNN